MALVLLNYELQIDIDMLKERLKTLENLIIGDGK